MTDFTERLTELSEQLHHHEHRTLALYGDKSDWYLTLYLSGEASLGDVTATITDACDRIANATKVRTFHVGDVA